MRKLRAIGIIVCSLVIVSCSHKPVDEVKDTTMPTHHWVCAAGTIVDWSFIDQSRQSLQLRLDKSDPLYKLERVYETYSGGLYSDGTLAFRLVDDNKGMLFWTVNDDVIDQNCVVKH